MGGWVDGWGQVKSLKIKNLLIQLLIQLKIVNSILFEDLSFVETLPPMGGCGWLG